jgi:hypothetical protein
MPETEALFQHPSELAWFWSFRREKILICFVFQDSNFGFRTSSRFPLVEIHHQRFGSDYKSMEARAKA